MCFRYAQSQPRLGPFRAELVSESLGFEETHSLFSFVFGSKSESAPKTSDDELVSESLDFEETRLLFPFAFGSKSESAPKTSDDELVSESLDFEETRLLFPFAFDLSQSQCQKDPAFLCFY